MPLEPKPKESKEEDKPYLASTLATLRQSPDHINDEPERRAEGTRNSRMGGRVEGTSFHGGDER